jgi:uncharacterized protein (DUF2461 family)
MHLGDERCNDANRSPDDYPWDGTSSASCSAFVDPHDPKAVFQIIIGPWQICDIVALKQPGAEVVRNVEKVVDGWGQSAQATLLRRHVR